MIRLSLKWLSSVRAHMTASFSFSHHILHRQNYAGKNVYDSTCMLSSGKSHLPPKYDEVLQTVRVSGGAGSSRSAFVKSCHRLPSRG